MDAEETTTLSIPSLLLFTALLVLLVRHFFFRGPAASYPGARGAGSGSTPQRIPTAAIDTAANMFPQLSRRDIEWDLRRNGGSVQATTERVLRTGGLDAAPPSFRAQTPPPEPGTGGPGPARSGSASSAGRHPDLITRYNLSARVAETSEAKAEADAKSGWSSNKTERAEALKRRREEMVLEARRRMLEREKGKARA